VDATKLVANSKEEHGNSTCVVNEKIGGKGGGGKVGPEKQIIIIEPRAATSSFNQRIREARVQPKEKSQKLGYTQTCQNPSFICQFQALIKILS
jgi:hypothetical protein